jgi:hypothetical protein
VGGHGIGDVDNSGIGGGDDSGIGVVNDSGVGDVGNSGSAVEMAAAVTCTADITVTFMVEMAVTLWR